MFSSWFDLVYQPLGGFLVVFLGTLLLFAEVLVKGRFIFGLVGLSSISLYFFAHMQEGQILWMAVLYTIGLTLVVLDGKFIGDGTVGAIGVIVMITGLALPSPDVFYGISVGAAYIMGAIGSLVFLKFFPRRDLWSKLTLRDTLSSDKGYNAMNESYKQLLGKEGMAETRFNPTGTVNIDGVRYSATSAGRWIEQGSKLRVTEVSGTRILVELIEDEED